jgi:hypothetical protein
MKTESDIIVIGDALSAAAPVVIEDDANENPLPKGATRNDDGSVTVKLRVPVALKWRKPGGDVTEDAYPEFTMHRLRGSDMMVIQQASKSELAMVAIAQSVRIPPARFKFLFNDMDAADIQTAGGVISYFLNNGPTTGP